MGFTHEDDADAVNTLLTYYFAGDIDSPSHTRALEAWETLAESAHNYAGIGWTPTQVVSAWRQRGQMLPEPNLDDADECDACYDATDLRCRAHYAEIHGEQRALAGAAKAIAAFAEDPEMVDAVLDQHERNRKTAAEHQELREVRRIVIDADCPNCGWAERWFDSLWTVFGCSKCDYTSQERNT